ncbi:MULTISPECIES: hypothetical protein [unclassified Blastococcus]
MYSRALPAALHPTALSAHPLRTGNLLADCERWCRDQLAPRGTGRPPVPGPRTPSRALTAARAVSALATGVPAA